MVSKLIGVLILIVVGALGAWWRLTQPKMLDVTDTQAKIQAWAEDRVATIDRVICPEVEMAVGIDFDCAATFKGGKAASVHVEQRANDRMYFYFSPQIVNGEKLAQTIIDNTPALAGAHVSCGKGTIEVVDAGVRCTVTGADGTPQPELVVTGNHGEIQWKAAP